MILDELVAAAQVRADALPDSFPKTDRTQLSLLDSIRRSEKNAVIAELKYASPSRGVIKEEQSSATVVGDLIGGGACALSVLTEPTRFAGSPDTIPAIRNMVQVPILRKDFIVDVRQLDETLALGADAVLLISSVLGDDLDYFVRETERRGLEPLVEVHTRQEAKQVLDTGADLIGINNRNLRTFVTDLSTTKRISPILRQEGRTVISASGVIWPCDIRTLSRFADGFLIGSSIMASQSPRKRLEGFVYA